MRILVGTIGQTILSCDDDEGQSWRRLGPRNGLHSDGLVRTMVNDAAKPEVVWAGTDKGIYRSDDGGQKWRNLGGPFDGKQVWRIALHPSDPKVIFAGTGTPSQPAIFRSDDGGASWKALPVDIAAECDNVGVPRVTDIAIDPVDPSRIWASIEVDGVRFSRDGGESWTRADGPLSRNPDGHAAFVTAGPPKSVVITMSDEVYISQDDGANWRAVGVRERFACPHVRDIVFDPGDPCSAWAAVGDFTPGTTGALMRTRDLGQTWRQVDMPAPPNSAMWVVRTQPDNPRLVLASSRYGYVYRSDDAGQSWRKWGREFSEISSIVWIPS